MRGHCGERLESRAGSEAKEAKASVECQRRSCRKRWLRPLLSGVQRGVGCSFILEQGLSWRDKQEGRRRMGQRLITPWSVQIRFVASKGDHESGGGMGGEGPPPAPWVHGTLGGLQLLLLSGEIC